jgi:hypothetical protein
MAKPKELFFGTLKAGHVRIVENAKENKNLLIVCTLILFIAAGQGLRIVQRQEQQKALTACKSNLKNLGTAMEMYSTDFQGRYPEDMNKLVPEYLEEIPNCPAANRATYRLETGVDATHNDAGFKDYYYLYCGGENHTAVSVPSDLPAYNPFVDSFHNHRHG